MSFTIEERCGEGQAGVSVYFIELQMACYLSWLLPLGCQSLSLSRVRTGPGKSLKLRNILEFWCRSWKVLEIWTGLYFFIRMKALKFENREKVLEKSFEKSWNFLWLMVYEPCLRLYSCLWPGHWAYLCWTAVLIITHIFCCVVAIKFFLVWHRSAT